MCWFECYSKELYLVNFWLMFMVANLGLICTSKVLTRIVRWTPTLMVPYTVPTTFYESLSASGIWSNSATIFHSNGQPGCLNLWTWSSIVESDISSLINVLSHFLCLIYNLPRCLHRHVLYERVLQSFQIFTGILAGLEICI